MSYINLTLFCSRDRNRGYLHFPFAVGDYTYATNGHVAIRVPGVVALPRGVDDKPNVEAVFAGVDDREFRPFEIVEVEPLQRETCKICQGTCYVIECDVCDGEGDHECDNAECGCLHECGACKGRGCSPARQSDEDAEACDECDGSGRRPDNRYVDLGGQLAVLWRSLKMVQDLPGPIEWAVDAPKPSPYDHDRMEYEPVAFRGPGWVALIMPSRWHDSMAIQVYRHEEVPYTPTPRHP